MDKGLSYRQKGYPVDKRNVPTIYPLYKVHQEHNDPDENWKADGSNQACFKQGEGSSWFENCQNKCGKIETNQNDND